MTYLDERRNGIIREQLQAERGTVPGWTDRDRWDGWTDREMARTYGRRLDGTGRRESRRMAAAIVWAIVGMIGLLVGFAGPGAVIPR